MALITSLVPCIVCQKPQTMNVNKLFTELYGATSFAIDCLDGSRHDLDGFYAVICDDCIDLKLSSKSLIQTSYAEDILS